ncbi:MAG: BtrH N-terminal domain-containing protein [Spirochaetes bacterium]|nr:BtrH N-terminal domain-containing protein [Spirochaetota bacterium]
MMKHLLILSIALTFIGCGSKPWQSVDNPKSVILPNIRPQIGGHCESSAMYNVLYYLDYPFNEADIVGGGGAIGFMYQKGDFPFLGGRNYSMRENFFQCAGIKWHKALDEDAEDSWKGIMDVLKQGLPVVLRVDMRYLPYLYGGKYGPSYMSFGWHIIALFGIDFEKEIAFVTDTALEGLQTIKLKDLEKARSSDAKVFPPHREYYWVEKKPADYQPDWQKIFEFSIAEVIKNYEWQAKTAEEKAMGLGGLLGLKDFENELIHFEETITKTYLLPPVFEYLYGCIETNGTGGAAFRIFYRNFLTQMSDRLNQSSIDETITSINNSINAWHQLSNEFQEISKVIKKAKKPEQRKDLYLKAAEKADHLYLQEKEFYEILKKQL